MMKINRSLWLLCLLVVGIKARPESASEVAEDDAPDQDSRMFNPQDFGLPDGLSPLFPAPPVLLPSGSLSGSQYNLCNKEGDMFYEIKEGSCWVCACFYSYGGVSPKCAPCKCGGLPPPKPDGFIPAPVPIPLPPIIPIPIPSPVPEPLPQPIVVPLPPPPPPPPCPPPVVIPGPPRPYPVPVPVPGKPIYIRVPYAVPSPPEKIYIPGPSVPIPIPIRNNVPVPYPVNRPIPIPVPSPPVQIPVDHYIPVPGKKVLVPVPVPVTDTKYYPVRYIVYVDPICRNKIPLVPFPSSSEPCKILVCKVKYNYVYAESSHDPSCGPYYGGNPAPIYSGNKAHADANAISGGFGGWSSANAAANAAASNLGGYGGLGGYSNADAAANAIASNGGGYGGLGGFSSANAVANAAASNLGGYGGLGGHSNADASANVGYGGPGGYSSADATANAVASNGGGYGGLGGHSSANAAAHASTHQQGGSGFFRSGGLDQEAGSAEDLGLDGRKKRSALLRMKA